MIRVAVDAMGGDYAPMAVVIGALEAIILKRDLKILFVGCPEKIEKYIKKAPFHRIEIVPAPEVIEMHEEPVSAVKKKKNSSIVVATRLVSEGAADALVSAGHTGAFLASCVLNIPRIKGISRPALAANFPTGKDFVTVLDVGGSINLKPKNFLEFALMGVVYHRLIFKNPNPRVGLLNIGEESGKGTDLHRSAFKLLSESILNFVGNVEGSDILRGVADVVVTDGFTGNVLLKFAESVAKKVVALIKSAILHNPWFLPFAVGVYPIFKSVKKKIDYTEHGGAPLLGIQKVALAAHGKSSARAIRNAVVLAYNFVKADLPSKTAEALEELLEGTHEGKNSFDRNVCS